MVLGVQTPAEVRRVKYRSIYFLNKADKWNPIDY